MSADSGQFDAHSAQSVFCHAHVAAENISYCFRVCGRETLRGILDILKPLLPGWAGGDCLSKKWLCRFFEKASLRSAPLLPADSGQFDAHSAQSVFCHAHAAAENESYCFRVCGRETLRGIFDILKPHLPGWAGGVSSLPATCAQCAALYFSIASARMSMARSMSSSFRT